MKNQIKELENTIKNLEKLVVEIGFESELAKPIITTISIIRAKIKILEKSQ